MSTPIDSPSASSSRSSSGTDGSDAAGPGMLSPWRDATAPPTSTSASTSPAPACDVDTRSRTEPSAR